MGGYGNKLLPELIIKQFTQIYTSPGLSELRITRIWLYPAYMVNITPDSDMVISRAMYSGNVLHIYHCKYCFRSFFRFHRFPPLVIILHMVSRYPTKRLTHLHCTCPLSHYVPFRTEMCTFLFWMVHCGIWDRYIVGFVSMVYCLFFSLMLPHGAIMTLVIIGSEFDLCLTKAISFNQWWFIVNSKPRNTLQ